VLPRVYENHLLSRLAHTDAMTLEWEHVELPTGPIPDTDSSRYVYFPCDGLIVLGAHEPFKGMQVALVGRRGSSGVFFSRALSASAIIRGRGWRVPRATLHEAARQSAAVDQVIASDNDELVCQVARHLHAAQMAVVSQRVAAWLNTAAEQSGLDALHVTHEGLAQLLGIRRSGVTTALHQLEANGAIRSSRGRIALKNRRALEQCAMIDPPLQEARAPGLPTIEAARTPQPRKAGTSQQLSGDGRRTSAT
jgi:hypothetical protein